MPINKSEQSPRKVTANSPNELIIQPSNGLQLINWRELIAYKDLFRFLIWRQIKVRYAQSAIGIGWAVIQPLFSMIVFTVVFGNFAKVASDGAPYALFSLAALLPWTYFSNAVTDGVSSLVGDANLLRKVYFPRILLPLSAVAAKLIDFLIAGSILAILLFAMRHPLSMSLLYLPLAMMLLIATASGVSVWLTALAVQYRDVKHGMNFLVQLLMYASPVVYSSSIIPEDYRILYSINPLVAVIDLFRFAILGSSEIYWPSVLTGFISSTALLISGLLFFSNREKLFADVA